MTHSSLESIMKKTLLILSIATLLAGCGSTGPARQGDKPAKPATKKPALPQSLVTAAENGNPAAQYRLGVRYFEGDGVKANADTGLSWLTQSAEAGYAQAQYEIGRRSLEGDGVKKDFDTGFAWLRLAADQGLGDAEFRLAEMYEHGDGVDIDADAAIEWYRLAGKHGKKDAFIRMRAINKTVEETGKLDEIEAKAAAGDSEAQFQLAQMYEAGESPVERDIQKAIEWFTKASDNGHAEATANLAWFNLQGTGMEKNPSEAVRLGELSAQAGNPLGQYVLAVCLHEGSGTDKDDRAALDWLRKSLAAGNTVAESLLHSILEDVGSAEEKFDFGVAYFDGAPAVGGKPDYSNAARWFRLAAEDGLAESQYRLGLCLEQGRGIPTSAQSAINWYLKAKAQGHEGASQRIDRISAASVPYNEGMKSARLKDHASAIQHFSTAIEADDQFIPARFERAQARYRMGDPDGALEDFLKVVELSPVYPHSWSWQAVIHMDRDEYADAAEDFTTELEHNRGHEFSLNNRARCRMALKLYAAAEQDMNQLVRLHPKRPTYWVDRGVCRQRQNDLDNAIADYTKAISLDDTLVSAYRNRADALVRQRKFRDALDDIRVGAALNPDNATFHTLGGFASLNLGEFETAAEAYSRALKINPENASAWNNLAVCRINLEKYDEAIEAAEKALGIDDTYMTAWLNRGDAYEGKGEHAKAISDWKKAEELGAKLGDRNMEE